MKAKLKYSINDVGDRYRHFELDTRFYTPQFHIPMGYKFDDFGWELVNEVKEEIQIDFAHEATDLIDKMFLELKVKLNQLQKDFEQRISDRVIDVKSEQVKESV